MKEMKISYIVSLRQKQEFTSTPSNEDDIQGQTLYPVPVTVNLLAAAKCSDGAAASSAWTDFSLCAALRFLSPLM